MQSDGVLDQAPGLLFSFALRVATLKSRTDGHESPIFILLHDDCELVFGHLGYPPTLNVMCVLTCSAASAHRPWRAIEPPPSPSTASKRLANLVKRDAVSLSGPNTPYLSSSPGNCLRPWTTAKIHTVS